MLTIRHKIARTSFAILTASITCMAGACCFVRGTKILTPKGPRSIEEIAVGDEVYAFDVEKSQPIVRPVAHILRAQSTEILHIAAGELVISGVTAEHPFYHADRKEWIEARKIAVGMRLIAWQGSENPREIEVTSVRLTTTPERVDVFNLTVDGPEHNYFAEGLLVHNKSPAIECTDDDGDGHPCCREVGSGSSHCETPKENCTDGIDNDRDSLVDELDPDCEPPLMSGKALWNKSFGDALQQRGNATAWSQKRVVVAGEYEGTVDFGLSSLPSADNTDAFVMRLSSSGEVLWSKGFGGPIVDRANGVAISNDSVYVTGEFRGTVDFGAGPVTSAGGADAFVLRYNGDGSLSWAVTFGGPGDDTGTSIVANNGSPFVAGEFQQTADFGFGPMTSAGGRDVFLVAFDAFGNPTWGKQFGTSVDDAKPHLAQRNGSRLAFSATLGTDLFLANVDVNSLDHTTTFANTFPAGGGEISIATTLAGTLVAAGHFFDSVDLGAGVMLADGPGSDAFVAMFDADGALVGSQQFGGAGEQRIYGLDIDNPGNGLFTEMYVTGTNDGILNFGNAILNAEQTSSGFVAKLQSNGIHEWSRSFSSMGHVNNRGLGITIDGDDGSPVFTGSIDGTIDLGLGPITGDNANLLIAKLHR